MKRVLHISYIAPHDRRAAGGSKTHNYYLKKEHESNDIDMRLLSFEYEPDEYPKVLADMGKYGIDGEICLRGGGFFNKSIRYLKNIPSRFFLSDINGNFTQYYYKYEILKHLKKYKEQGYEPDVIVVEWTQLVLFIKEIRTVYPFAKYVAIEHDVSFLGAQRKFEYEKRYLKKQILYARYEKLKKAELRALSQYDLIYTLNPKDARILIDNGIDESTVSWYSPKYDRPETAVKRCPDFEEPFIIFFGAMDRPENYLSVIWFIENVFFKIDKRIGFFIVGNKPSQELKKYTSDRIVATGFVEDIGEYFEKCLCMVAPLQIGAGIKIKILEAMAAGVPVLTNDIGIEGIEVERDRDYVHCETPEDYITAIEEILNHKKDIENISISSRQSILKIYNYKLDSDKYIHSLINLK